MYGGEREMRQVGIGVFLTSFSGICSMQTPVRVIRRG